jgi:threonyl-tRNA synthetase
MQKKIRQGQLEKIPYLLVVGDKEAEAGTAAVRVRSGKDLGPMPLERILERVRTEAESRKDLAEAAE